ncbi:MAG TPA: DUF3908 family protein [Mollicutes bacterium]|mgnify:CR=1 FL=1|nr:DUF3908 family protein [Mollicutes bacterium]
MIEYSELSSYFETYKYYDETSGRYSAIFSNIEELIDTDQIKIFYPKNLKVVDKDLEVFLILDGKILYGKSLENNDVEIKVYFLKDINDITYKCSWYGEDSFHKISLKFNSDVILEFDSMNDATSYSRRIELEMVIKEIIRMLMGL